MGNSIAPPSSSSIPLATPLGRHVGRRRQGKNGPTLLSRSDPARERIYDLNLALDMLTQVHASEKAAMMNDDESNYMTRSILQRLANAAVPTTDSSQNQAQHGSKTIFPVVGRDPAAQGLDAMDRYQFQMILLQSNSKNNSRLLADDNVSAMTGEEDEDETLEDPGSMTRLEEIESLVKVLLQNEEMEMRSSSHHRVSS